MFPAGIAQLVEQLIRNQQVVGSSPIPGSTSIKKPNSCKVGNRIAWQFSHFSFPSSAVKKNLPREDYLYFVVGELRHFYIFLVKLTDPFGKTNCEIYQIAF
jgi:hypothetical protein